MFKRLRNPLIFFACQALSYGIVTYQWRAIAHDRLAIVLLTDAINCSLAFFVMKRIAHNDSSKTDWLGYLAGSLVGTTIGMLLPI